MSLNLSPAPDDASGAVQPNPGDSDSGNSVGAGTADSGGKRGRGRPRKPGGTGPDVIDPAAVGNQPGPDTNADAGAAARKSARRAGAKEKAAPVSVEAFIFTLGVTQMTLATATGIPEFLIGDDATKQLATAAANVARHYPVIMTQKQQDIGTLFFALGMIGYTQTTAFISRKGKEAAARKAKQEADTVDVNFSRVQ